MTTRQSQRDDRPASDVRNSQQSSDIVCPVCGRDMSVCNGFHRSAELTDTERLKHREAAIDEIGAAAAALLNSIEVRPYRGEGPVHDTLRAHSHLKSVLIKYGFAA